MSEKVQKIKAAVNKGCPKLALEGSPGEMAPCCLCWWKYKGGALCLLDGVQQVLEGKCRVEMVPTEREVVA